MKVSVLIPVYNKAHCVKRCVESITNQTYKDLEILVYDDGSTDDSIGEVYKIKDERIRILEGKHNVGISRARNILMEEATGEMSAWQDADDYSNPWRIESQMAACKHCGVLTSRTYRMWISRVSGEIDAHPARNPVGINYRRGSFAATLFPSRPVIPFHLGLKLTHELLWGTELGYKYGYVAVVCAAYYYYSDEPQPFRTMDRSHSHNTNTHYWETQRVWRTFLKMKRTELRDAGKSSCPSQPQFTAEDLPEYHGPVQFKNRDIVEFQRCCEETPFRSENTCVYLSSMPQSVCRPSPTMSPLVSTT